MAVRGSSAALAGTTERTWRSDWLAPPSEALHPATTGLLACALLVAGTLGPLLSSTLTLPDLSGIEAPLAVAAWLVAILGSGRVYGIDAIVATLGLWAVATTVANDVAIEGAALHFALLSAPFTFLRVAMFTSRAGLSRLTATVKWLVLAQVAMLVYQLSTRVNVDDLKGTFVGTQYGEHVAAFIVLVAVGGYASTHPRSPRARAAVLAALGLAYLADSKVALGYFLIVGLMYLAAGRSVTRRARFFGRVALTLAAAFLGYAVYTGALGGIPMQGYVHQSLSTGGGKVAVARAIVDPRSNYWHHENYLFGAGSGQTVSRTAHMSVPSVSGDAPALRVGADESAYYLYFTQKSQAYGYVAASSVTAAASSALGILGDLGLIGLGVYGAGYVYILRWIGRVQGYRSWPALAWVGLAIPGLLGEWLEFPIACMSLVAVLVILRQAATPGSEVGRGD